MKLDPCSNCGTTLNWVTTVKQAAPAQNIIVLKCSNDSCGTVYHIEQPEGWKEPAQNFKNLQAIEQNRQFVRDKTPQEEVNELLKDLQSVSPDKINEEYIRIAAAKVVFIGMLYNTMSKRPTVRQRALDSLARITFRSAPTNIDVTSKGEKLQGLTTEEIISKTAGIIERLKQLADENGSTDSGGEGLT